MYENESRARIAAEMKLRELTSKVSPLLAAIEGLREPLDKINSVMSAEQISRDRHERDLELSDED